MATNPEAHSHSSPGSRAPILIAGPTAVGKSAIALALAERIDGEIISVDSMQVYRGLDIGTAKPSPGDRARVPHHLIDVAEVTEPFDAARFVRLAEAAIRDVQARRRVPILCGGTGLYFKAFLEGLGEAPGADTTIRAELESTPLHELLRELEQKDSVTFAKIDCHNPRRVIRAVEVIRLTGKPFSTQRARWRLPHARHSAYTDVSFFGFVRAADDLRARIDARVEEMFARGLIVETERLLKLGLAENRTARQAIGYRQVIEHLRGERSLADTVTLVKQKTRQFAKRQMTWFRRQFELEWMNLSYDQSAERAAAELVI